MSSSNSAISVKGLGKEYRIAHEGSRATTLGEALTRRLKQPTKRRSFETFQALRDISFEVERGEVLGVIGRNGAGKSTLLKILSRITDPTYGEVRMRGRVGSLLEVGTGFHPELTGRENVYLNGAILGMRRKEIERQFDAIVDFAEVERFLDTPVKRYSSGMYVRLAFAVAAHLNPEILIVDEVLAVGDVEFQKKCLGKMQDVSREDGRTVLFVSHNMGAIRSLCSRAVLLSKGRVEHDGDVEGAIGAYLHGIAVLAQEDVATRTDRRGNGRVRLSRITLGSGVRGEVEGLLSGGPAEFTFEVNGLERGLQCLFTIYDDRANPVVHFNSAAVSPFDKVEPLPFRGWRCEVDSLPLSPGRYRVNVGLMSMSGETVDHLESAATFEVFQSPQDQRPEAKISAIGPLRLPHVWSSSNEAGAGA